MVARADARQKAAVRRPAALSGPLVAVGAVCNLAAAVGSSEPIMLYELGEGRGERMPDDLLGVDFEPLEDGLVEHAALRGRGALIADLDVFGDLQGDIKRFADLIVADVELLDQLLGGAALPADTGLLLLEQRLADVVVVVGGEQLSLLSVDSPERIASRVGLGAPDLLDVIEVVAHGLLDLGTAFGGQFDGAVVAHNRVLNRLGAVVAL